MAELSAADRGCSCSVVQACARSTSRAFVANRRNRLVAAEAAVFEMRATPGSDLCLAFNSQARTFRVNEGNQVLNSNGVLEGIGFTGIQGTDRYPNFTSKTLEITDQFVVDDGQAVGYQPKDGAIHETFWLASGKITDSLFIAPAVIRQGINLRDAGGERRDIGVRSAAISAGFILSGRAALELDADPEEFEIMDPRVYQNEAGERFPLLQITDRLINGSGYCKRLFESVENVPRIITLVRSILQDNTTYPMRGLLQANHMDRCDKSCYLCLQRYGNQPYHGLLDWRLGLAFLQLLEKSTWLCGLDGDFSHPSLADWPTLSQRYVQELVASDPQIQTRTDRDLSLIQMRPAHGWHVVVHPLWDTAEPCGILRDVVGQLPAGKARAVSSFELARRLLATRHTMLTEELPMIKVS